MQLMNRLLLVGLVIAVCGSGALPGCKDQAKCDEAIATSKKSMQDEFLDMKLAREWRDHAGKACGAGPEVEALDKEILAKEAAIVKAAEDKAKAEAEAGQKAIDAVTKVWDKFDDSIKEEKDKEKIEKALKKADKDAKKAIKEAKLTPDYGKQVLEYNKSKLETRKKKLEAAK